MRYPNLNQLYGSAKLLFFDPFAINVVSRVEAWKLLTSYSAKVNIRAQPIRDFGSKYQY